MRGKTPVDNRVDGVKKRIPCLGIIPPRKKKPGTKNETEVGKEFALPAVMMISIGSGQQKEDGSLIFMTIDLLSLPPSLPLKDKTLQMEPDQSLDPCHPELMQ